MYAALFTSLLPCFVTNDVYVLVVRTRQGGAGGICARWDCLAVGGMGLPHSM